MAGAQELPPLRLGRRCLLAFSRRHAPHGPRLGPCLPPLVAHRRVAQDVATGLTYLHAASVLHLVR